MALSLHRAALDGISAYAGNFRPAGVEIQGSRHTPPGAHLVPGLIEEMCDYVNDNWDSRLIRDYDRGHLMLRPPYRAQAHGARADN